VFPLFAEPLLEMQPYKNRRDFFYLLKGQYYRNEPWIYFRIVNVLLVFRLLYIINFDYSKIYPSFISIVLYLEKIY